jgi:hypothetical protein
MKTLEFESAFFSALADHISSRHHGLTCTVPPSGTYLAFGRTVPSPDVVVTNPSSGAALLIEVKGDRYGKSLPYATLPEMKAMREALQHTNAEVMLISTVDVPEAVLARLREQQITVARARTVDDAINQIETKLAALETSSAVRLTGQ